MYTVYLYRSTVYMMHKQSSSNRHPVRPQREFTVALPLAL
jgi:hypothetical protein